MQVDDTSRRSDSRIAAIVGSWKLGWQIKRARKADRAAARILGGALAGSSAVGRLVDEVRTRGHAQDHLETAIRASLEEDRADFAVASASGKMFVIIRGLAARAVLRDRLKTAQRERDNARERLGRVALEGGVRLSKEPFVVDAANRARNARAQLSALVTEDAALLEPFGGSLAPDWVRTAARELSSFASTFARVLGNHFVPRLPALAAMGAGWWVTRTFTDSHLGALLHGIGLGTGPRYLVSTETLAALQLWVPIGAAVICAYVANRLAAKVRARYALAPQKPESPLRSYDIP
ncbi:MAG TPA: hypothetical protein VE620_12500, partial [Myxococcales bacterium]|nr:hypothetical protein [Myxococcales bacterium]